jgi:pyruvate formate lyase activating enzyme
MYNKTVKEAYLYQKLKNKRVQCQTCSHRCIISLNQRGICGVRKNKEGRLYSLVYGKACACNIDPIEKKPLYHFQPGSKSLSIATIGCNFRCPHCQNWQISQLSLSDSPSPTISQNLPPEKIVEEALKNNCQSIAYTYTEPTIFLEYALDTMKIAKTKNLANVWVSNGYMTPETIDLIENYLEAINIDLKSFSEKFYQKYCLAHLKPVLDSLKLLKKKQIHLEVTTLVIPTLNDSDKELTQIAEFIFKELGSSTPWHISRFYPAYQALEYPVTPINTLVRARKIGLKIGLKYVYLGNVDDYESSNTYCPKCGALMIERIGYNIKRFDKEGRCSKCGTSLDLI